MTHYRKKVDSNQKEIIDGLRKMGRSVLNLSRVGEGCPDILVGYGKCNFLVEIKTEKGKLTPSQVKFNEAWRGLPVLVCKSLEDIIEQTIDF